MSKNFFDSFINKKISALLKIREVISNYYDILGKTDPNLEKIKNQIISSINSANRYKDNYFLLMELTENQLVINCSNERIKFEVDVVYSTLALNSKKEEIRNRKMNESQYWSAFFAMRQNLCSMCGAPINLKKEEGGCICSREHPNYFNKSYAPKYLNPYYADSNYIQTKIDLES